MKFSKWKIVVSSILILLPMLFGLLIFKLLPSEMAIHFGVGGEADGYANPLIAVTVIPLVFLAIHLVCFWLTSKFYKGHMQENKIVELVYWMIPLTSIFSMSMIYAIAFDLSVRISMFIYLLLALMFIFIGNYLPKCRRNHMMGIKIKWTLANEENWNMTHRFAGKVWFGCGIACLPCMLIPDRYFMYPLILILAVTAIPPFVYSYLYYKKQVKEGTYTDDGFVPKFSKKAKIAVISVTVVLLIVVAVLLFTGSLKYVYSEDALTVEATYYEDLTIRYDEIENIKYLEDVDFGHRQYGYGSFKLSMGIYKCDQFGKYTRYTYNDCDACVVLTVKGKTVVLNESDAMKTKELYEDILQHCEKG